MALNKLDIGAELDKAWKLFRANMALLIIAGVIATLLSAVTFGILGGPMLVGLFLIIQRLLRNDPVKPQAGDIFKGFDAFVQSLILIVIAMVAIFLLAMIPVLGQLAGLFVGAVVMWAMMFVAFKQLTAVDAIKKVFAHLQSGEFTMPLLFAVLASLVAGVGVIACCIGVFFTIPIGYSMLVCGYETLFGREADRVAVEPPSVDGTPQL